jgi:hypothetical protein
LVQYIIGLQLEFTYQNIQKKTTMLIDPKNQIILTKVVDIMCVPGAIPTDSDTK